MKNKSSRARMANRQNKQRIMEALENASQGRKAFFDRRKEFTQRVKTAAKKIASRAKNFVTPVKQKQHRTTA
jgi:hypothetical protein